MWQGIFLKKISQEGRKENKSTGTTKSS